MENWLDRKDNIPVVTYDAMGRIVPIPCDVLANGLKAKGILYVLSEIYGSLYANETEIGCFFVYELKIGKELAAKKLKARSFYVVGAEIGLLDISDANIREWFCLPDTKIRELITSKDTKFGNVDFRGTKILEFGGKFPEIDVTQYRMDKNTELPKSLITQLPSYQEVYEKTLKV